MNNYMLILAPKPLNNNRKLRKVQVSIKSDQSTVDSMVGKEYPSNSLYIVESYLPL